MSWPPRGAALVASAVLAAAVGMVTGIASLGVHNKGWPWALLAVAAPVCTAVALRAGWLRATFGLGWLAMLLVGMQTRPEGDYVVMSNARGYVLLLGGLGLLVFVIVTLPVRRHAVESGSAASGT